MAFSLEVYVVVNFLASDNFCFLLFLGIVMYVNRLQQKKINICSDKKFSYNIYTERSVHHGTRWEIWFSMWGGLDMISFGAFVMCWTQLAEHAARICPIIS